jgi:primosomal protein N' (replication factor Y)
VFRSRLAHDARNAAESAAATAHHLAKEPQFADIDVLGPSECPLAVIADNHRYQLIVRARRFQVLQHFVKILKPRIELPSSVYLEIDVDPVNMM